MKGAFIYWFKYMNVYSSIHSLIYKYLLIMNCEPSTVWASLVTAKIRKI